jgi:phosphatidylglycerol:prolipoprotein diacylglycerol transferase
MEYIHNLDPVIINLWGDIGIRWYGTAYLGGFLAAFLLMKKFAEKGLSPMEPDQVADFITYIAVGTIVGGRLGYVLFYNIDLLWDFRPSLPFWGALAVNEGGMASHGGMIGITVSAFMYGRKIGVSPLHLCDLICISGPFGSFFGRVANFINGELVGRAVQGSHWFTVKYPSEIRGWALSQKGRLADAVGQFGVSSEQWNTWIQQYGSSTNARVGVDSTIEKIILALKTGQAEVVTTVAPLMISRYPSQLYAALTEGVLVFAVLLFMWRKPLKPGLIGASYLVVYGFARILNEQFRTPDAHLGFQALGMTRGQWLSVGMVAIGAVLIYLWNKRSVDKIGGWASK